MSNDIRFGTWKSYEAVPVLPSIEILGYDFLAPYSLALFISALEMGVIVVCFTRFMARRAEAESSPIKLLVYFLTFVSLFQTGTTFAAWWKIFVVDFGNWGSRGRSRMAPEGPYVADDPVGRAGSAFSHMALLARKRFGHHSADPLWKSHLTFFLDTSVQLLKRRWFIALPLVLLVIGTIITTIYVMVILFRIQFASKDTLTVELHTFFTCFAACLAFSAAIDIFVTGIREFARSLYRAVTNTDNTSVSASQFSHFSSGLVLVYTQSGFARCYHSSFGITWESAIPPCTCALAALIACIRGAPFVSYWAVLLQTILGKLYVISLFVTLEGRAKLADVANLTHFPTLTNTSRLDRRWSSIARDVCDQTDPIQGSQLPMHAEPAFMWNHKYVTIDTIAP
ncbi:hypothetical protein H4582DRAFT_2081538 [Lactarius indigo]|nr:hypothetical protein H4582DRAFT_2081538 [Lactarius indigo]